MNHRSKNSPTGVKVIGWILLFLGLWNLIFGIVALTTGDYPSSSPSRTLVGRFIGVFTVWAGAATAASVGLLLRKELGRISALILVYLLMTLTAAWATFFVMLWLRRAALTFAEMVFKTVFVGIACIAELAVAAALYFLARYLRSEKVRAAFRK